MNRFLSLTTLLLVLTSSLSYSQENTQKLLFEGICSQEAVGSCEMLAEPFDVKLIVSIDNNSNEFTVKEFWMNEDGLFEEKVERKWTGQALNKQALRFSLEIKPNCGSETRMETLHFIGVINCDESICHMKLEDTFAMCPAYNCIFNIQYDLILSE